MSDPENQDAELEEYLVRWLLNHRRSRRGGRPGDRLSPEALVADLVGAVESGDLRADALLSSTGGAAARAAVDRVLPWPERTEADLFVAAVELAAVEVRRGRTREALVASGAGLALFGFLAWSIWRA